MQEKMASGAVILGFYILSLATLLANAADPDPVLDFCVANNASSGSSGSCRDPSTVSPQDFVSELLRNRSNSQSPNTFVANLVSVSVFPGLNTMGISIVRVDFGIGGVVPTHVHPRSSELIYVQDGTVLAGFVDTNNVLFSRTLQRGDMLIVPRGLLHFQYNVGNSLATVIAVFNSQEPGLQLMGPGLFGSGIPTPVLESSLSLNQSTIEALRGIYAPSS